MMKCVKDFGVVGGEVFWVQVGEKGLDNYLVQVVFLFIKFIVKGYCVVVVIWVCVFRLMGDVMMLILFFGVIGLVFGYVLIVSGFV